ncbi:Carbonyl reductase NADPH 3 [Hondaea fermentalgiana]|uniref:Carbonyl reductase NADPH 3 n=1 Tax=Hondaea fermentalgiana TaxID=2315210 RepID=A0A2R5GAT4_9STRA|nr:Carbonyl reductase NADPH 3 [Hondaea fermentalgiana]|eukprot:GBG27429.1 Carbonyl reductase NADPH 3 [Hondaea fermentalgiana]
MAATRVFVVTGANQGIGFETVRRLARRDGLHTIMTARNAARGQEALEKLHEEFPQASIELMELDLDDDASQDAFVKTLEEKHRKLSCLVNNAGIAFNSRSKETFEEQTEPTLRTNLFQTIKLTERLLPILQKEEDNPRVVVVASQVSKMAFDKMSSEMQERITAPDLTTADVLAFAEDYKAAVRDHQVAERGFATNNYGISKLCAVQFTRTFAREHPEIVMNSCCPGWCATRLGSSAAPRSAEAGAEVGIGFETVRKLARKEGLHTIMTARNEGRGKEALEKLQEEFPKASLELMELDLDDDASQEAFIKALKDKHGKVSCLVNNAGIAFNSKSKETFEEQTEPTFKTNLFQTFKFTERVLPFLQKEEHPRIVTVASEASKSAFKQLSTEQQKRITSSELKPIDVFNFAEDFMQSVRDGKVEERGFATNNYGMSKLCVVQYTRAFAREHPEILVNCCCPGWCSTRMGSGAGDAPRTPEQGAEVLEFLATADLEGKSGEFWSDNKVVPPFEPSSE